MTTTNKLLRLTTTINTRRARTNRTRSSSWLVSPSLSSPLQQNLLGIRTSTASLSSSSSSSSSQQGLLTGRNTITKERETLLLSSSSLLSRRTSFIIGSSEPQTSWSCTFVSSSAHAAASQNEDTPDVPTNSKSNHHPQTSKQTTPLTSKEVIVQLEQVLNNDDEIYNLDDEDKSFSSYYEAYKSYKKHLTHVLRTKRQRYSGTSFHSNGANPMTEEEQQFLSSRTAEMAIECLLLSSHKKLTTISSIRQEVRDVERLFGNLLQQQQQQQSNETAVTFDMTDRLSYLLLKANSRGGNVGRCFALLELRHKRHYPPQYKRKMKLLNETHNSSVDNDNETSDNLSHEDMSRTNTHVPLADDSDRSSADYYYVDDEYNHAIQSIHVAGRASSGGEGKGNSKHHRQRQQRRHTHQDDELLEDPTRWLDFLLRHMKERNVPLTTYLANRMLGTFAATGRSSRAMHHFYKLVQQEVLMEEKPQGGNNEEADAANEKASVVNKVIMQRNKDPPDYKVPSKSSAGADYQKFDSLSETTTPSSVNDKDNQYMQLSKELELKWSPGVTAAFAFAKSLSQGVYGHAPVALDLTSWNVLMKICCYRGALHRALYLLKHVMPHQEGFQPDIYTYNVVLHALARVGDTTTQMNLLMDMTNSNIMPNEFTVQALVKCHISKGDISTAVTLIQDLFNQYHVLPFVDTNFDVMEAAIANDLPYEAKRHFFFLQQLWKYVPPTTESEELDQMILDRLNVYRTSPRMNRNAIERFFQYHQIELTDNDFLL